MPAATITVRELKNKDTGIDLSIPTYQEVPGRLGSVFEYNVVVVSRLSYFKSPKHKELDNVQFTIQKKFPDFEDLYSKMSAKFSGTVFPPLPKKALIVNDATAKERRSGLENFLKFLSKTPKLSTSSLLLEFLGVNAVKAGKFRQLEVKVGMDEEEDKEEKSVTENEEGEEETLKEPNTGSKVNLFDEEQEEDADLFLADDIGRGDVDISSEVRITAAAKNTRGETKLFEDIDLGGGIESGKENMLLFVPTETGSGDQSKQRKNKPSLFEEEGEDNSDLFRIDDDLDQFLSLDLKSKFVDTKNESDVSRLPGNGSPVLKPQDLPVPVSPTKETHSPDRPKPAPRAKPSNTRLSASLDTFSKDGKTNLAKPDTVTQDKKSVSPPKPLPRQKPPVSRKPQVEQKPPVPPKPVDKINKTSDAKNKLDLKGDKPNEITQDDILKYIRDNTADKSDDLDLFS